MNSPSRAVIASIAALAFSTAVAAQTNSFNNPTWWNKYRQLLQRGVGASANTPAQSSVGANADASKECGPQSETFIAINPGQPETLAGGSNEIFRLPMRGYFSTDSGSSWGGVDLPLPSPFGSNGTRFGSDPSLAFDTRGSVFYSYIVVFFSNGKGKGTINGTEMAAARSSDGGATYPHVTFFSFSGGQDHFNDKPMITADTNLQSPFRDHVYVAWDTAGGSSGGGIRVAHSSDHGASFSTQRVDNLRGRGRAIGAVPFVGANGEVYAAWNDYGASAITFNRSFDGGNTWGTPVVIALQSVGFQATPPAQSFRGALEYPSCAADRSSGAHRGRLYCAWMDRTLQGTTDILVSFSDDRGGSWSAPEPVADQFPDFPVDRFFQWLAVDPVTGDVNVSFYDTRNDATGFRYMTDVYFTQSTDGGATWRSPNTRVSSASSNEHDCGGLFPCNAIDYGNQYGDYEGVASFGGVSHPIWTDSRDNQMAATGCSTDLLMEEVFSATVK